MADNAQGATPFQGAQPPAAGPNAFFPVAFGGEDNASEEGTSSLDTGADAPASMTVRDPLGATTTDLDFGSIRGEPCPDDKVHDSLGSGDDLIILGG